MEGWLLPPGIAAAGGERVGGRPRPSCQLLEGAAVRVSGLLGTAITQQRPGFHLLLCCSPRPGGCAQLHNLAPTCVPCPGGCTAHYYSARPPPAAPAPVAAAGEPLLDLIADSCLATRDAFDPRSLTHVLWSLARLGYVDETFYAEFVPVVSCWGQVALA